MKCSRCIPDKEMDLDWVCPSCHEHAEADDLIFERDVLKAKLDGLKSWCEAEQARDKKNGPTGYGVAMAFVLNRLVR